MGSPFILKESLHNCFLQLSQVRKLFEVHSTVDEGLKVFRRLLGQVFAEKAHGSLAFSGTGFEIPGDEEEAS